MDDPTYPGMTAGHNVRLGRAQARVEALTLPRAICERFVVHTIPSAGTRQLRTGDCLADRYAIIEVVGRGGMAMVFRATDVVTGVAVAVKVINSRTREASDRFLREARVLSELVHPAVVRYVGHGITP